jgi:hypothetical protein
VLELFFEHPIACSQRGAAQSRLGRRLGGGGRQRGQYIYFLRRRLKAAARAQPENRARRRVSTDAGRVSPLRSRTNWRAKTARTSDYHLCRDHRGILARCSRSCCCSPRGH